jgi:filamentous hemagglutinin
MNKHHHRIVFNAARGALMAVAETARSQGQAKGTGSAKGASNRRTGPRAVVVWVLTAAAFATQAQIRSDVTAPANQQFTVLNAGNGIPLVNIPTPSNGLSHFVASQFDVLRNGAILNNSRTGSNTQLAGWQPGNPYMAGGMASSIMGEVRSNQPSNLQGFIEVAGQRARVIIVNPAGITCDGCGFINAHRTTLTTGTPVFNGQSLDAFLVRGGVINITGAGLQTQGSDFTDLIARALNVNAGVWANQLQVITGVNQVSAEILAPTSTVTKLSTSQASDSEPAFAIDTAQLGGMYAGKIVLVGTEAGVGVRNAGQIGASAGQLSLSSDGQVINTGKMQASSALNVVTTQGLDNQGTITAQNATVRSASLVNTGQLQAVTALGLQVAQGLDNKGSITSLNTTVQADTLNNQGDLVGQGTSLQVKGLINTGKIDGQDTLIRATNLINQGGGTIFGDHLSVAADTLTQSSATLNGVTQAPVLAARQRLDLGVGTLLNQNESTVFSAGDMFIGGTIDANGLATGPATLVDNRSATIEALGSITLRTDQLSNRNMVWATRTEKLPNLHIVEYQGSGSPNRYAAGTPGVFIGDDIDTSKVLITPEGRFENWLTYDYTRERTQTVVSASKPAHLTAGGDMQIEAFQVLNANSHIVAGGNLSMGTAQVNNQAEDGALTSQDHGTVTSAVRHKFKPCSIGNCTDYETLYSTTPYQPAATHTNLKLSPWVNAGNTVAAGLPGAPASPQLPASSLYKVDNTTGPVVQVNPAFAGPQARLSSDAQLTQLAYDPATVQKRLGDGFYEQKLMRDQVAQLTGRRFLAGYTSDEAQYQALMDQGATVASQLNIRPGVSLSAEQAAQLTSDIVWLETVTVTLPNGSSTQALAPKVYLKPRAGDLQASGDLISASNLTLQVSGNVINSGEIGARQVLRMDAQNLINQGGSIAAGKTVINAGQNIDVHGGTLQGQQSLSLSAGQDINVSSTLATSSNAQSSITHVNRVAGLYVSEAAGQLLVNATRDVNLQAAQVSNQGTGGSTTLVAGRDLSLGSVTTTQAQDITWNSRNKRTDNTSAEVGSSVQAAADITLQAGRDLHIRASTLQSDLGQLEATAAGKVNIEAGQIQQKVDESHFTSSRSFLSKSSTSTRDTFDGSTAQASTLSAASVNVQAGTDLRVQGSNVVSDQGTRLQAGRDVRIEAARQTQNTSRQVVDKSSGLMDAGSSGIAIGSRKQANNTQTASNTTVASTVGATQGNVGIEAGQRYSQVGSDVIAPKGSVAITAQQVDIDAATQSQRTQSETRFQQTGVTVSLSTPLLSAAQTAQQMSQAASQTSDSRMKVLAGTATALSAVNAVNDLQKDPTDFTVSIMLGRSTSKSQILTDSQTVRGSQVAAGQDITVVARAAGGSAETGLRPVGANDITVRGSTLQAGGNVALQADRDVNLLAAKNTASERSTNSSSSASIGVKVGTKETGVAVGASQGKGRGNGDETTYTNAQVNAGQQLSITSGTDTTLKGAVTKGEQVVVNVGGQLNLQSLQDTSTYQGRQQNVSGGLTIGPKPGGNAAFSQSRTDANFASVGERTGIHAGDQGFQVNVAGKTDLIGAVIASTDKAVQSGKNTLNTQSLTTSDIQNLADFKAQAVSVSVGTSAGQSSAGFGQASGKASSTSTAGVSGIAGDTSVRTGDKQQGIQSIFDKDKVSKDVNAQVAITSTFGQQAAKAVGDHGQAKMKPIVDASLRQDLDKKLSSNVPLSQGEEDALAGLNREGMTPSQAAANLSNPQLKQDYDNWKEGGSYRVAAHLTMGAIGGGTAGALAGGGAAAAAPTLDKLQTDLQAALVKAGANPSVAEASAKLITQATATVGGAVVGAATGSGTAGLAQGAMAGFNVDGNNRQLHDQDRAAARRLYAKAQKDGKPYTLADIEDALRYASVNGESVSSNTQFNPNMPAAVADKSSTDPLTRVGEDAMSPGKNTNAKVTYIRDGQGGLIQNVGLGRADGAPLPKADLVAFIQSNNREYSWAPGTVQSVLVSTPVMGINGAQTVQRQIAFANGQIFSLPVAPCPAVSCANDNPIAWFSTEPGDQQALASYKEARAKEDAKAALKGGLALGTTMTVAPTLLGSAIAGGLIAGGNSAVDQRIDTGVINGQVVAQEALKGTALGVASYGGAVVASKALGKAGELVDNTLGAEAKLQVDAKAVAKAKIDNNFYGEGASSNPVGLQTSAGIIPANPNKTTTVLGRYLSDTKSIIKEQLKPPKSEDFGARPGGFNVLNVDDAAVAAADDQFFEKVNKPFLEAAAKRGDDIALATIPEDKSEIILRNGVLRNTFAKELDFLVTNNIKPANISTDQWNIIKGWFK